MLAFNASDNPKAIQELAADLEEHYRITLAPLDKFLGCQLTVAEEGILVASLVVHWRDLEAVWHGRLTGCQHARAVAKTGSRRQTRRCSIGQRSSGIKS